ncbi:MAG: DUF2125 domain-containing protein [Rhodospirillales bacterium]|nr:DUF2125 domain-containing protein [Rhodospirillales bacterium]
MNKIRHRTIIGIILGLLAMSYVGFWFYTADQITSQMENWTPPPGHDVQWQSLSINGFPFQLAVELEKLTATDGHGNQWSTDHVDLAMRRWDWRAMTFNVPGSQEIVLRRTGGTHTLWLDSEPFGGIVSSSGAFTLNSTGLNLRDDRDESIFADSIRIQAEITPQASTDLEKRSGYLWFSLNGIQTDLLSQLSLGNRIDIAAGEVELYGPLPHALKTSPVSRWQAAGGIAEVRSFRLDYGPMNVHTEGTLALDKGLQPVGAFTARIRGFGAIIDILEYNGTLGNGEALTAKFVLSALAQTDSTTNQNTLEIPISIQDRFLYAGPLKLTRVPPVQWAE